MESINAFVINLDRRTDRYIGVTAMLKNTKIKLERHSAVDGMKLTLNDKLKSRVNPWNLDKRNIGDERRLRGILGCCLSHLFIYYKISQMKDKYVMVFEDDVVFRYKNFNFNKNWESIDRCLPEQFGLVWLNTDYGTKPPLRKYNGQNKCIPCTHDKTTEAYILTPAFAKVLYDAIKNNLGAIDHHMNDVGIKLPGPPQIFELENPIFTQTHADSDIQF